MYIVRGPQGIGDPEPEDKQGYRATNGIKGRIDIAAISHFCLPRKDSIHVNL
jgi:hypothetical protein